MDESLRTSAFGPSDVRAQKCQMPITSSVYDKDKFISNSMRLLVSLNLKKPLCFIYFKNITFYSSLV